LLTDFGTRDHYVASMKGVVLGINPRCTLVDITHQVRPHDIDEGAFILANAYSCFPKGTIHLSVVDPGVGSPRRPVLLVTRNYFFVGPDNGLLTLAAREDSVKEVIDLTNPKFFLSRISTTFHGRDIFAPVAAHLSLGIRPGVLGPRLNSWVKLDGVEPRIIGGELVGKALHIDAFGNLISNISEGLLFQFSQGRPFVVRAGAKSIHGLEKGYWEGKRGDTIALIGSGGFLEISVKEGSARRKLKIKRGDKIKVLVSRG
jgi:S-adenosyl-L-methionine hydrolase (adenosine-forming)